MATAMSTALLFLFIKDLSAVAGCKPSAYPLDTPTAAIAANKTARKKTRRSLNGAI
ncbi:MAG: hypothetical protein HQL01_10110 [Nitrospirae bacterium]|nr:hypothetical protein [Nitrospirota bacterium]